MNINEECLLQFLKNPSRLDKSLEKLTESILSLKNNVISCENTEIKLKLADG